MAKSSKFCGVGRPTQQNLEAFQILFQISLMQHTPHIAMDATLSPTDAMPPVPAALPSDAPTPAAIVVGTLPLPHAAALPPTAVDASVNAPPAAAVGVRSGVCHKIYPGVNGCDGK